MAGKQFDISRFAETLSGVSKLDTDGPERIEYLDIGLLDGDERNFYALSDLKALADNIQVCGLQQPIRVRSGAEGRFTIVSGHRRRAALLSLVDRGLGQFRRVPCIRETDEASPALQELRLIFANSATRQLTGAELGRQAERVEALFVQLKAEGYPFPPGRMRDLVAEACRTNASKLARLKRIREGLLSYFMPLWESGKMPEQCAYALSQFPDEMQMRIVGAFPSLPTGSMVERLLSLYKEDGFRWKPDFACPDGTSCRRGAAFLRHDAKCLSSETCGGKTCCLSCSRSQTECYACNDACSKAKSLRKEQADKRRAAAAERETERIRAQEEQLRRRAERLAAAADAAGIPDTAEVLQNRYGQVFTAGRLRALAGGNREGIADNMLFYADLLAPENFRDLAHTAKTLRCSADYLVGLTETLSPAGEPAQKPAASTQSQSSITALAQKYADKAQRAYDKFQETGESRYDREQQHNADVADALFIAAEAAEDHQHAAHLKSTLADLSVRAAEALSPLLPEAQRPAAMEKVLKSLAAYGRMMGVIT